MSFLYVVAGANGVGKTTFAKDFAKAKNLKFLNADEVALKLNSNPEKVKIKAGKLFLKQIAECIKEKQSFIIESTLSGSYLKDILKDAQLNGYNVVIIYIFVENPEICIKRVENRILKGGHSVPHKDIKRRFFRSIKLFYNEYRFISDLCYLINNTDDDFEEIAVINGDIIEIINEDVFNKFLEVINEKN
ncbi:hypothetical protein FHQ18_03950 [Deferribacter autotrophicus]|uniref:Zeta toxin domain-containing protein n=1 Tax=Deferribacter autotrophicus TaxID=500465 RepID=A0A5A8F8V7_9BACT|nr:zeta toxin family protein [Deferribacter autotrophicus]KAA0259112.1 hypothetical protein FHQ18_03950 [Deferribacter autotrophicus]